MSTQHRRFVFIDFENLKKVKFKKLEKVATRIFIFINAEIDAIPSNLVYHMQKLGKEVKWFIVNKPVNNNMNYHISFLMGKLHQKLHRDVEFAVLSNDKEFDPLISFINSNGRSCLRVKRKKTQTEKGLAQKVTKIQQPNKNGHHGLQPEIKPSFPSVSIVEEFDTLVIEKTAEDTMQRLIRSGNRPAEIASLKNYIKLHNQELSDHRNIEEVIRKLEETKDIQIEQGAVIYNF